LAKHTSDRVVKQRFIAVLVVIAVGILINVLLSKHAQLGNAQLQKYGEQVWPGYNTKGLSSEPPTCDLKRLKQDLAQAELAMINGVPDAKTTDGEQDEEADLLDELIDDEDEAPQAQNDLKAKGQATEEDESGVDDLLDELTDEGDESGEASKAKQTSNLEAVVTAYKKQIKICESDHAAYQASQEPMSASESIFRSIQGIMMRLKNFGDDLTRPSLVLLFLVCGFIATLRRHHIALRPAETRWSHGLSELAQFISMTMLSVSFWFYRAQGLENSAPASLTFISTLWFVGLGLLALMNLVNFISTFKDEEIELGSPMRALLSVPLYAVMCLISGGYFFLVEQHGSGLAIYLSKLHQNAALYMNVGLYVWVGMMLKNTRIAQLCFDVVRPFQFPPEILAFVIIVGSALPTAYSGASGIFVIAAGALIFTELKRSGARTQLALATTAMSGSMGVVLRPCLLVFIVASLNNVVTSDQLYTWGIKVFLLSATLFLLVSLFNRQPSPPMAPLGEASRGAFQAFKPLIFYLVIIVVLVVLYAYLVEAYLDENSAPFILPVLIISALTFETFKDKRRYRADQVTDQVTGGESPSTDEPQGVFKRLSGATDETTIHIGALLTLMGLSVCIGGIIERSEIMSLVPVSFGSVWLTMSLLVVVLVIIGMSMDPYGAVILVSVTIAQVAYKNGINPIHFWMVVLVAFELGYLTPPVALNHLLTRQVIGEEAFVNDEAQHSSSFYVRHERLLLPIIVMGITLMIVAFGPLLIGY
jgi:TRAP-type C4-dicarboxylate transport system permease large subunit